jgi:3-oxoacyl-[acyl-carrier protein] reductase
MAYSAAKAALINFTKTLAKQLAPSIMVNAIAPGFVESPLYDRMPAELTQGFINGTLIKRYIRTSEIAESYLFLARSEIITGEVLVVDGGFTLKVA